MVRHVISVCIFCFLCATHSPCASHAEVTHLPQRFDKFTQNASILSTNGNISREKEKLPVDNNNNNSFNKRNSENDRNQISSNSVNNDSDLSLKSIFLKYGDGETMTIDGFKKMVADLSIGFNKQDNFTIEDEHLGGELNQTNNETCIKEDPYSVVQHHLGDKINSSTLKQVCPILLSTLLISNCENSSQNISLLPSISSSSSSSTSTLLVWIYSIGAVIVISACGVFAVIIIPVMQKRFYKPLLQFLVALAVGTLAGDALLHLLPHAMSSGHGGHHHDNGGHQHEDDHANMWKGFVAMLGLTLFFAVERFIPVICRKRDNKGHSHVTVLDSGLEEVKKTQCMDKYNPYPRCYKDIINDPHTTFMGTEDNIVMTRMEDNNKKANSLRQCPCKSTNNSNSRDAKDHPQNNKQQDLINKLGLDKQDDLIQSEINKMLPEHDSHEDRDDYTVILREHGARHHGHSHVHGHVHAAPQNLSSVAWMVIMGDGLHNFTDGMAIGAAFSGGITGGFSTTVAVFCHELPHELGDFAMLLKAGMSIKQALFYNILSSVLCILGNIFGVWLGNTEFGISWVFAVAAGTFLYIALVDMIPELSSEHEDEGNLIQCVLHLGGLLLGFGIMTLIALYEHDLKNMFTEPT